MAELRLDEGELVRREFGSFGLLGRRPQGPGVVARLPGLRLRLRFLGRLRLSGWRQFGLRLRLEGWRLGWLRCRCWLREFRDGGRRLGGVLPAAARCGPAGEQVFRGPRHYFRGDISTAGVRRRQDGRSGPAQGPLRDLREDDRRIFRRDWLVIPQRSTGDARALVRVPALVARVLAAGHAEVEGPVELLGDASGLTALDVHASAGHRLVQRSFVVHDEVLQALRQDARASQGGPLRGRRTEGVAGATPLAIRVGEVAHLSSAVL